MAKTSKKQQAKNRGNYKVGYGKPPQTENSKEHRFKPGQSGNLRGRGANSFKEARELAQAIGNEIHPSSDEEWTRLQVIFRSWAASHNPNAQRFFVEYAIGKVPDEIKLGQMDDSELVARAKNALAGISALLSGTTEARLEPSNTIEIDPAESVDVSGEQSGDSSVSESAKTE